jgi:hypothetical protein
MQFEPSFPNTFLSITWANFGFLIEVTLSAKFCLHYTMILTRKASAFRVKNGHFCFVIKSETLASEGQS